MKTTLKDGSRRPDGIAPHPQIKLSETQFDGVTYVAPSWEQMGQYTFELARKIIDSGQSFDRVVALAKGGWTWARTLVDYIEIDELSSARIKSYKGDQKTGAPIIHHPLPHGVDGETILLFDEVIDTGETIIEAVRHLKEDKGAKDIKIATLCYKPRALEMTGVKADFEGFRTDAWVVFPHELREFVVGKTNDWRSRSASDSEIKRRFDVLGLPAYQVDYFINLVDKKNASTPGLLK